MERRPYLADILRPFYNDRSREENKAVYGRGFFQHYEWEHDLYKSDALVLPYGYHYLRHDGKDLIRKYFTLSERTGKKILVWNTGDFSYTIDHSNAIDVRTNAYRSKMKPNQVVMPVFIRDPFVEYADLRKDIVWSDKPVVGFVGQAVNSIQNRLGVALRGMKSTLLYNLKLNSREPNVIQSPQLLRWHILEALEKSGKTVPAFVRHERYRAGLVNNDEVKSARERFYRNIFDSEYIVCVRGGGNFSVRLYETLACGRIPLVVDTDVAFPSGLEQHSRNEMVMLSACSWRNVADVLVKYHKEIGRYQDLTMLSQRCRSLWETHCTFPGFFSDLAVGLVKTA